MFATMYAARGVGLAANQIGVGLRVFVIDCPVERGENLFGHVVNPSFRVLDESGVDGEEGCLSVPDARTALVRPAITEVTGVDVTGTPVRLEGHGYAARCLQHETDHLDGRLYLDRLAESDRARVLALHRAAAHRPVGTSPFGSPT